MIESVYRECQEHLRENHRKRDQLVAFFGVVMAAYLASYDGLADLLITTSVGLAVFSSLGLGAMAYYRRWHWLHLNAAVVYERIWWLASELSQDEARKRWEEVVRPTLGRRSLLPFSGLEATMYYALAVATALPAFVLGRELGGLRLGIVAIGAWIALATALGVSIWRRAHVFDKDAWMFRFLAEDEKSAPRRHRTDVT